jgi:hypothetical protein
MSIQQTQSQWTKFTCSSPDRNRPVTHEQKADADMVTAAALRSAVASGIGWDELTDSNVCARSVRPVQNPSAEAIAWEDDRDGEDFAFVAADGAKSKNRSRVHHFNRVHGATAAERFAKRAEKEAFKPVRRNSKLWKLVDPKGVSDLRKLKNHVQEDTV